MEQLLPSETVLPYKTPSELHYTFLQDRYHALNVVNQT